MMAIFVMHNIKVFYEQPDRKSEIDFYINYGKGIFHNRFGNDYNIMTKYWVLHVPNYYMYLYFNEKAIKEIESLCKSE